jgi:hypothetical protein
MAIPTVELQTREPEPAAPRVIGSGGIVKMFERLACDPNADVEKIEHLVALFERSEAKRAADAFNVAMSEAQANMRPIAADASNPQTHSRYASYAALDNALRPIYTSNGFGLTFNTADCPLPDHVRVICDVVHTSGHTKPYRIDMPADGKGAKGGDVMTKTHATGSAVSYGMRYLLKMIFNIAVGEADDDGNAATAPKHSNGAATPPEGYDEWLNDLRSVADEGLAKLQATFRGSLRKYTQYLTQHQAQVWKVIKAKAEARR